MTGREQRESVGGFLIPRTLVVRYLLAMLVFVAAPPSGALAAVPDSVHTRSIATDLRGNGHAVTWDGRVFVLTSRPSSDPERRVSWVVRAFRPEAIGSDANGLPDLVDPAATSDGVALHAIPRVIDDDFTADDVAEVLADPASQAIKLSQLNAIALGSAPGVEVNPYPSDENGVPVEDGDFETYRVIVVTQRYGHDPFNPSFRGDQFGLQELGQLEAEIVVSHPRTEQAAIHSARFLSAFTPYETAANEKLRGIEPTITFDGRLLIYNGHPANDGVIDVISYAWNEAPFATSGWSEPRSLNRMHAVDRDRLIEGVPFHERFPLAKDPLTSSLGEAYDAEDLWFGAYPWVSHDGSELVHTVARSGIDQSGPRRASLSIVGRLTGFSLHHIDGPLNPSRAWDLRQPGHARLFFSSPGLTPGFWQAFRDAPDHPLADTSFGPVYPLFGSNSRNYGEVYFPDADHVLYLHLNEGVDRAGRYDPLATPDRSRGNNPGRLEGLAAFPQEYVRDGEDRTVGAIGQGIYFGDTGAVRVADADVLSEPSLALTIELWVKRLVELYDPKVDHSRFLISRPGAYGLVLEADGRISASVETESGRHGAEFVGSPLPLGAWAHVAVTWDGATGSLRTFLDGSVVDERSFPPGSLLASGEDLLIGPANGSPAAPFVGADEAILVLDEVLVSRIVRSDAELARDALRPLAPDATLQTGLDLPLGLEASDLMIPAQAPVTAAAAELGSRLFAEPGLSSNGLSCASCHREALRFADGLALGRGSNGQPLRRNTPTLINRAFSTRQFLDGRADSLEAQALAAITAPEEMNADLDAILEFLADDENYAAGFQAAFGAGPTAENLAIALATHQRTILAADSVIDRFEAGLATLSPAEELGYRLFHGKARCVACHSGSNYSDEQFHNTALAADILDTNGDRGRAAVTGRLADLRAFKTPTLRDLPLTAPYFHDGSAATLEAVVDAYARGGRAEEGRDIELRPLDLDDAERLALVAFLRALKSNLVCTGLGACEAPPMIFDDGFELRETPRRRR